jgi:iron complex outermembrane receptor protein
MKSASRPRSVRKVQFNLAAFYYDYQNYQAYVQVGYTQLVRNLPATIKGIEAEVTAHPIRGLTLQASGAVQDSKVKGVMLPDGLTVVNHDLPQAPGFSANALARYEFNVGDAQVSVQGDAMYSGASASRCCARRSSAKAPTTSRTPASV